MDTTTTTINTDPILWLLGAAALGLLAWALYRFFKARQQRAQAAVIEPAKLPDGATRIRDRGATRPRTDRSGRLMLVLVGTFAMGLGSGLLKLIDRGGLEACVGSILLLEMDRSRREKFLAGIPAVFRDRVVPVGFSGLAGGLGNRSPEEVLEYIDRWGPPVINGAARVCELHQRRQNGDEAALVLAFISLGGQAIIGVKAVETIRRLFRQAQFYAFIALPVDDRLRLRVERVLDDYRQAGVHGFVTSDNLADEVRNDFGMVASIAGFAVAAEDADAAVEQNNAWYLLFREAPGGLVSFSTYVHTIPGYPFVALPGAAPEYYVFKSSVVGAIQTGLEDVTRVEFDSLAGAGRNGHEPLTSRFDIALAAIYPDDLKEDEDDVVLGQVLKGQSKRNYHLIFAPITTEVDPARPLCPVGVVSLRAVHQGTETLKQLTTPLRTAQLGLDSGNGQAAQKITFNRGA